MGIAQIPAASGGLTTTRFPAAIGNPFNVPAGLTLQQTITSSTSFAAGTFPSQIWVVLIGGGGSGSNGGVSQQSGGGGGGGGACIGWMDVPSSGTLYATIGSGGASNAGGTHKTGNTGGDTTLGALIAYGGGAGTGTTNSAGYMFQGGIPRGPGAGCGSFYQNSMQASQTVDFNALNAPYTTTTNSGRLLFWFSLTTGTYTWHRTIAASDFNNWVGGGAGINTVSRNLPGGDGLTGAGANGSDGTSTRGGNSSRDGGSTFTFTGATTTNVNGAGGAGFLANGSGSTGGSGGGGGGGMSSTNTSGAGGNGCILIYY